MSEDLDFFCEVEFEPQSIYTIIASFKATLEFQDIDFQHSFNRNLFFINFSNAEDLKLEFTYYPFRQVEPPTLHDGLRVDSLIDIAVNKLFTIAQKPRGRDYFDLYCIIQRKNYQIEQLQMLAKTKFDWHVDPLQLASRLNEVSLHLDDPILIRQIDKEAVQKFFESAALSYKDHILDK